MRWAPALAIVVAWTGACRGPEAGGDAAPDAAPPVDAADDAARPRSLTLADLMAPVTDDERAFVTREWAGRDHAARNVEMLATGALTIGTVPMTYRVLRHTVAGERHVGAVLVPNALTAPAPVLIYTHGGYTGEGGLPPFDVASLGLRVPGQPLRERLVYVVPAYRGERIAVAGVTYGADGVGLLGTTDVSDAAALLTAVVETTPLADRNRVAVFGESRGGTVALALAARDARLDLVVEAFGPTDFRLALGGIDPATFAGVVGAATGNPRDPANFLIRSLVPLQAVSVAADGSLAITHEGYREMRRRIAATSAVSTPLALPAAQIHHGTADPTSSVAYSRALRDAMAAAGRVSPSDEFTYYEYEGGTHDLGSLAGAVGRLGEAIARELAP